MKIVAISDTHSYHRKMVIPKGDVLVHAGDFTAFGRYDEFEDFVAWLDKLPHKHKIFIAGNHDECMEKINVNHDIFTKMAENNGIHYLFDSSVVIDGIKFYGSPWQPDFCNWSFQAARGKDMAAKWENIPSDTDVLITHGPPYGHGDYVPINKRVTGCAELLKKVIEIKPRLHIFGHIHEGYGVSKSDETPYTKFYNAAMLDGNYKPTNKAHRIELN